MVSTLDDEVLEEAVIDPVVQRAAREFVDLLVSDSTILEYGSINCDGHAGYQHNMAILYGQSVAECVSLDYHVADLPHGETWPVVVSLTGLSGDHGADRGFFHSLDQRSTRAVVVFVANRRPGAPPTPGEYDGEDLRGLVLSLWSPDVARLFARFEAIGGSSAWFDLLPWDSWRHVGEHGLLVLLKDHSDAGRIDRFFVGRHWAP